MTNKSKYCTLVLVVLCCIGWAACTQERDPCYTPKTAGVNIEFIHLISDTSKTLVADTVLPGGVFIALTDSGRIETIRGLYSSLFTISLSPVANTCKWEVATDTLNTNLYDTLTFYYKRNLQFLSNACGYTYFYSIDSVHTSHFNIDSVIISNASVTNNVNTEHLKVYIHPDY